ncbi:hypothetical protein [Kribbella sp. NPDC051620]|uniref:hypothetical protein n=1 Tax=Kribbella sp. NPDC051620 TaxID=3364120 RepID=UPI00379D1E01
MLFLNFGDKERALEFYKLRHAQGHSGTQIKTFEVPSSHVDSLRQAAVTERKAKGFPTSPLVVDRNKAVDQFGLRSCHIPELLNQISPGSGEVIC